MVKCNSEYGGYRCCLPEDHLGKCCYEGWGGTRFAEWDHPRTIKEIDKVKWLVIPAVTQSTPL